MNKENEQVSSLNENSLIKNQKIEYKLAPDKTIILMIASLLVAFFYSICFTGVNIYPMLSFFIFCYITVIIMYLTLDKLEYLRNRKAFYWAIPILIISSFNAIFQISLFSYINVIMVHILFAVLGYSAVRGEGIAFSRFSGWFNILKICCGNISAAMSIYKTMIKSRKINASPVIFRILLGIIISMPIILLIMLFLLDADAVFRYIVGDMVNSIQGINFNIINHIICITIVCIYLSGYIYNLKNMDENKSIMKAQNLDTIVGATFLIMINMLFLFFCLLQVTFLFSGGYMKLPDGIIYSTYAREGFFQLLFVTILNFGIIIVFLRVFQDCVMQKLIKMLLIMLSIFTAILICSSFYRMGLYISAYGYTGIRMMVLTFLTMEMFCVFVTIFYILKPNHDFLKRYMYIGLLFYILVNITSNQFTVASLNADRFYKGADLDISWFRYNPDSIIVLKSVVNSDFFQENIDSDSIEQANEIIENIKYYENSHWQNWSLLRSMGQP